jgi:leucyl-tRNA synthetase
MQDIEPDKETEILINKAIKAVTDDIEDMDLRFNTCVSEFMIFVNEISKRTVIPRTGMEKFIKLLSPFAPHIAEEIWQRMGNSNTIAFEKWPEYDEKKLQRNYITIVGQVNGKVRTKMDIEVGTSDEEIIRLMKEDEKLKKFIDGKEIIKEIVVKNKLVNIVVK